MSAAAVAAALLAPSAPAAVAAPSPPAGNGATGLTGTGSADPLVKPANLTVSASGDGITIAAREAAVLRHQLVFTGSVAGATAADAVEIERMGSGTGGRWLVSASSPVNAGGGFSVTWRPCQSGRFSIRALLVTRSASTAGGSAPGSPSPACTAGTTAPSGAGASTSPSPPLAPVRANLVSPALTITVYTIGIATIYGPGLYGRRTACGERLRRDTLGVANVKLRCGTPVDLEFAGHAIVVPVIDRGPYVKGVEWDLTAATARALGMLETEAIGAAALPMR